jgi:DnaJ-class molecular chaperone
VVTSEPEPDGGGGKLEVGSECPDCLGRGMVGDGTIENKCSRCNGTGKIQKGDPDVAAVVDDFNETVMTNEAIGDWISADTPKGCLVRSSLS